MKFKEIFKEINEKDIPIETIIDDIVSSSKSKQAALKMLDDMSKKDKNIEKQYDKIRDIIKSIPNNLFA